MFVTGVVDYEGCFTKADPLRFLFRIKFLLAWQKRPTTRRTCPSYLADIAKPDIMVFRSTCVGREERSLVDHPALLAIGAE